MTAAKPATKPIRQASKMASRFGFNHLCNNVILELKGHVIYFNINVCLTNSRIFIYKLKNTELYSLSDFKVHNDLAIAKAYLDGRFRAVPFISDEDSPEDFAPDDYRRNAPRFQGDNFSML